MKASQIFGAEHGSLEKGHGCPMLFTLERDDGSPGDKTTTIEVAEPFT